MHLAPVDIHHPDDNELMVELVLRGGIVPSFTVELPGLAPVPLPVTVYPAPTAVRESWVEPITAAATAAGLTVEPA
jgi:hypothetical protein